MESDVRVVVGICFVARPPSARDTLFAGHRRPVCTINLATPPTCFDRGSQFSTWSKSYATCAQSVGTVDCLLLLCAARSEPAHIQSKLCVDAHTQASRATPIAGRRHRRLHTDRSTSAHGGRAGPETHTRIARYNTTQRASGIPACPDNPGPDHPTRGRSKPRGCPLGRNATPCGGGATLPNRGRRRPCPGWFSTKPRPSMRAFSPQSSWGAERSVFL